MLVLLNLCSILPTKGSTIAQLKDTNTVSLHNPTGSHSEVQPGRQSKLQMTKCNAHTTSYASTECQVKPSHDQTGNDLCIDVFYYDIIWYRVCISFTSANVYTSIRFYVKIPTLPISTLKYHRIEAQLVQKKFQQNNTVLQDRGKSFPIWLHLNLERNF